LTAPKQGPELPGMTPYLRYSYQNRVGTNDPPNAQGTHPPRKIDLLTYRCAPLAHLQRMIDLSCARFGCGRVTRGDEPCSIEER
jgi:hypothetical protein